MPPCRTGRSIRSTTAALRTRSGRACRYLDASCGDHKIIWELNRHQHWLVLGPGVLADRRTPIPRTCSCGARIVASLEPAAHRRQLVEHARSSRCDRCRGSGPFNSSSRLQTIRKTTASSGCFALARRTCSSDSIASSRARRAQPFPLFQSQHAPARRGARALCDRTSVARARRKPASRLDRPDHPLSAKSDRQIGGRRRPLRAVHALSPLRPRFLHRSR